ncbi:MAG: ZIP family metal transporter [Candidatus Helarchaeota archaeon]|nr:ZIP family metal transporter [Candidatus Helarchaeota archaeon]
MYELGWIFLATAVVSGISLIGIITIGVNEKFLQQIVIFLVALSAGGLLGGGFLHLLPEAVEAIGDLSIYLVVILGFLLFFLIEKVLVIHHCHNVEQEHVCEYHAFTWLSLIGDGVHNFIDGLIIAASFLVSIPLGFATTMAVIFHEIPQEIGDFGVLVYGGFSKRKALYLNFLMAIVAIAGGFIGFFVFSSITTITPFLLAFAAGGFFYIAATDLIPELQKEYSISKTAAVTLIFLGGIAIMWLLRLVFE